MLDRIAGEHMIERRDEVLLGYYAKTGTNIVSFVEAASMSAVIVQDLAAK